MLKIVVFDGGWGGELVANFLMNELGIVEVIRVIDWDSVRYYQASAAEIQELAERHLRRYIGKVDAIVMGGFAVSRCLEGLKNKYPRQKFVGMGIDFYQMTRTRVRLENVIVMTEGLEDFERFCREIQVRLPNASLILPDCNGWTSLIDQNLLDYRMLRAELAWDFRISDCKARSAKAVKCSPEPLGRLLGVGELQHESTLARSNRKNVAQTILRLDRLARMEDEREKNDAERRAPAEECGEIRPDLILLLNTHFWEIKPDLERLFGWNVRVLDFRSLLLRQVCLALKLRGVDGRRSKGYY